MIIGLDVGDKRIGVAAANIYARVAHPQKVVEVNGEQFTEIVSLIDEEEAVHIVVGLPRNMDGLETKQTQKVRDFAHELEKHISIPVFFQDESLTSVEAERRLDERKRPYTRGEVDMEAASIILQDHLDETAGR